MVDKQTKAKEKLIEKMKKDFTPIAAKVFRNARNDGYRQGDWINFAAEQVTDVLVDNIFGILHSMAVKQEKIEAEARKKEVLSDGKKD